MGVDLTGVSKKKRCVRHHTLSTNPYRKLLVKLYKFLAQRTKSKFNKTVASRLLKSRENRAPISLSRIGTVMRRKTVWMDPSKTKAPIAVVVADVLDDIRLAKVPKGLRVCALRFSRSARQRIEGAGGECLTFDQLAMIAPTGKNTFLMRGRKAGEEKYKHFGAAGVPGSHAKPYVSSRGAEVGRGRRTSTGYKRHAFKHTQ
jgi:large subunit ribosomal protein L18e